MFIWVQYFGKIISKLVWLVLFNLGLSLVALCSLLCAFEIYRGFDMGFLMVLNFSLRLGSMLLLIVISLNSYSVILLHLLHRTVILHLIVKTNILCA